MNRKWTGLKSSIRIFLHIHFGIIFICAIRGCSRLRAIFFPIIMTVQDREIIEPIHSLVFFAGHLFFKGAFSSASRTVFARSFFPNGFTAKALIPIALASSPETRWL